MDQIPVRVGQIWEDQTPDMGARRIRVERLDERKRDVFDANLCRWVTEIEATATCSVARPNALRKAGPGVVKVRVDRLKPSSRGFVLVSYGCKPDDCIPKTGLQPADIGATGKDPHWFWTCEHGRPFAFCEDGAWEPCLTAEELPERLQVVP